jgi:hypothetical protein
VTAYIKLEDLSGKSYRLKLRDIADFKPLLPNAISLMPVAGCTVVLKNGSEIDINMTIDQLKAKIKW